MGYVARQYRRPQLGVMHSHSLLTVVTAVDPARAAILRGLSSADLARHVARHPEDEPLVASIRDERRAVYAKRARQSAEAQAQTRRDREDAEEAAQRPGQCPHGKFLEECDHPSCAVDLEGWVRNAKAPHRQRAWFDPSPRGGS